MAWGLCNSLRGVMYHMQKKKVLIPRMVLQDVGLSATNVLKGQFDDPRFKEAVYICCDVVNQHLERARDHAQQLPSSTVPVMQQSAFVATFLKALKSSDYNVSAKAVVEFNRLPF